MLKLLLSELPKTAKAAKAIGSLHYFTGKPCKRGHVSHKFASTLQCAACQRMHIDNAYAADPEKFRARARTNHAAHRDRNLLRMQAYRAADLDAAAARDKKYRDANPAIVKARTATWKAANPDRLKIYDAQRARAEKQATPPWLTVEQHAAMKAVYAEAKRLTEATGISYWVDHQIPLQGRTVRGLHVPWNLQILTAQDNLSKGISLKHPAALLPGSECATMPAGIMVE
jgi:hypothetical protein